MLSSFDLNIFTEGGKCSIVSGDKNLKGLPGEYTVLAFLLADDAKKIYVILINSKFLLPIQGEAVKDPSCYFAFGKDLNACDSMISFAPLTSVFDLSDAMCYVAPSSKQRSSEPFFRLRM